MKKPQKGKLYMPSSDVYHIHSSVATGMLNKFDMPEFVKLRWIAMRKQVQIAFFCNSLSVWEETTYKKCGKHALSDFRHLITETMKTAYLPEVEKYYNCPVLDFYFFEPCYKQRMVYGFTAKIFAAPLFKSVDSWHAPLEEKLASALATYIRQQYGRGPGQTSVALLDNRVLVFSVTGLLAPFTKNFVESDTVARNVTTKMLEKLFAEAIEFVCRDQYRQTYESFFEIDVSGNQMIALVLVAPLTQEDLG